MKKFLSTLIFLFIIVCISTAQFEELFWVMADDDADFGTLTINWAGIIDNGEGDKCPHGPWGKLYVVIYPATFSNCPNPERDNYYNNTVLKGPSSGNCFHPFNDFAAKNEWVDGDAIRMTLPIYEWQEKNEEIIILIYEGDRDVEILSTGRGVKRGHDVLFCYQISRRETTNGLIVIKDDMRKANIDAIKNCRNERISWHHGVWSKGLNYGIPKLFIQVETQW